MESHRFSWIGSWLAARLAGLARLGGKSVWLLGFVGRKLEPWNLPHSTLGEVGGFSLVVDFVCWACRTSVWVVFVGRRFGASWSARSLRRGRRIA